MGTSARMFDRTYDRNAMDVAVRRGCAQYQALVASPPSAAAEPSPPPRAPPQPASVNGAQPLPFYALPMRGPLPHAPSSGGGGGGAAGQLLVVPSTGGGALRSRAHSSSSSPTRTRGGGGGVDGEDTEEMMELWTHTYAKKTRRLRPPAAV